MVNKLVGCFNVFNEKDNIKAVLEESQKFFDEIIIADGAYINRFPKPKSTDGTLDILYDFKQDAEIPVTLIEREGFWMNEVYKRNWMLNLVKPGDFHFYLDGEWFPVWKPAARSEIQEIKEDAVTCWVHIKREYAPPKFNNKGQVEHKVMRYAYFAAFRKLKGYHFVYNHCTVADKDGRFIWKNPDLKVHNPGIMYLEKERGNTWQLADRKRRQFKEGSIVELGAGEMKFLCQDCGHGYGMVDVRGNQDGFEIPRGMPRTCPVCHSGVLCAITFYNS